MCEPITAVTAASAIIGAVGGGYNAWQQRNQGLEEARINYENAEIAEIAAKDAEKRGHSAANWKRFEGRQIIGEQTAAYGAAGIDVSTGTPVENAGAIAAISELDALTIENNAAREAWGLRQEAKAYRRAAETGVQRGGNAAVGTLLGTAGQTFSAAADSYSAYRKHRRTY